MSTITRHEAEAIALSLAEGKGVVIRDTQGIGEPQLGRIEKIDAEYVLVSVGTSPRRLVRFERSTGCAMLAGEHDRWKLTACGSPSSEEYGDLLIRQARLQAERERVSRELDLVSAVLETADEVAMGGTELATEGENR